MAHGLATLLVALAVVVVAGTAMVSASGAEVDVADASAKPHPWPGGVVQAIDVRIKSPGPAGRRVKGRPIDELIAKAFEPADYAKWKAKQASAQKKEADKRPKMPKTPHGHRVYKGPPLPRGFRAPPDCPTYPFCWQIPAAPAFGPRPQQDTKPAAAGGAAKGSVPKDVVRING